MKKHRPRPRPQQFNQRLKQQKQKIAMSTRLSEVARELRDRSLMRMLYERLGESRLPPDLLKEKLAYNQLPLDCPELSEEENNREAELDRLIYEAVPPSEIERLMIQDYGYGISEEYAIPAEFNWPQDWECYARGTVLLDARGQKVIC